MKSTKKPKEKNEKVATVKITQETALENLKKQYAEYVQQAKIANEMALKSQGAIEVLEALIGQEK